MGASLAEALNVWYGGAVMYRSTALDPEQRFARNLYYADWGGGSLQYNRLESFNPYGETTIGNIEKYVLSFFENASSVAWDMDNSVFTFKDANAVAKFYPNNVLEFADYKPQRGQAAETFTAAYAAAAGMLQKDKGIVNEYYLSGYEQSGNGWFFTFDYTVNGFPVFISQSLSRSLSQSLHGDAEMTHMIEVEVQNDKVYKYKRYALGFEADPTSFAAKSTSFADTIEQALEGSLNAEENAQMPIQSVTFGYRADAVPQLSLQWLIYNENDMPLPSFE